MSESPWKDRRRKERQEREKRLDELVKKSMRVGMVVGEDGRLVRFGRV